MKLTIVTPALLAAEFIQIGEAAGTERCDALRVLLQRQAGHLLNELCAQPGVPELDLLLRALAEPMARHQPCEAFEAAVRTWLHKLRPGFDYQTLVRTLGEHGAICSACRCIAAVCAAMSNADGGEAWSMPLSKNEMARRLGMKRTAFKSLAAAIGIRRIGPALWALRLDGLDATSRGRLTGAADPARFYIERVEAC